MSWKEEFTREPVIIPAAILLALFLAGLALLALLGVLKP